MQTTGAMSPARSWKPDRASPTYCLRYRVPAISDMDSSSTTGLSASRCWTRVLPPAWVSFATSLTGNVVVGFQVGSVIANTFSFWRVLPLSVSIASILVLIANVALDRARTFTIPSRVLTGAYLACGPSLAALGLSTSVGMASPVWLELSSPVLLPLAAWAYYHSIGKTED